MSALSKLFKSTDPLVYDKIKFLLKDPALSAENYYAICEIIAASIVKPKVAETSGPATVKKVAGKPAANTKQATTAPVKVTWDADFYEKAAILPTFTENMKILALNYNFERMLRHNIIECMNKMYKMDTDKDAAKYYLEEQYQKLTERFVDLLCKKFKKEKIEFPVEPPINP
jgi:hypothetical protein